MEFRVRPQPTGLENRWALGHIRGEDTWHFGVLFCANYCSKASPNLNIQIGENESKFSDKIKQYYNKSCHYIFNAILGVIQYTNTEHEMK